MRIIQARLRMAQAPIGLRLLAWSALASLFACDLPNPCRSGGLRQGDRCLFADARVPIEGVPSEESHARDAGRAEENEKPRAGDTVDEDPDADPAPAGAAAGGGPEEAGPDRSPSIVDLDGGMDGGGAEANTAHAPERYGGSGSGFELSDDAQAGLADTSVAAEASTQSDGAVVSPCALSTNWRALAGTSGAPEAGVCAGDQSPCAIARCAPDACADAGSTGCTACADALEPWQAHEVPICWTEATATREDFGWLIVPALDRIWASWSAVADIEFVNVGVCTPGLAGVLPIQVTNDLRMGAPAAGYRGASTVYAPLEIGLLRRDSSDALIPHLLGHVLGFAHDMPRVPVSSEPSAGCHELPGLGTDAGVARDPDSIMATIDACDGRWALSRSDIVAARRRYGQRSDTVVESASALYARKRSNGDIHVRSGAGWSKISGPVGQMLAVGQRLYALSSDLSEVLEYEGAGTAWQRIGHEARELVACAPDLCVLLANGVFARYRGGVWTALGGPAIKYAATSNAIYRLTVGRKEVQVFSEQEARWNRVGPASGSIYATSTMILATDPYNGDLRRYTGETWTLEGIIGRQFVGVGPDLYALTPDLQRVFRHVGPGNIWSQVPRAGAKWLYGGPRNLYQVEPATMDILLYDGSSWQNLGQP